MPREERTKGFSIKQIAMIIGIITGCITIVTFGGAAVNKVDTYIVTDSELAGAEQRIIQQIRNEAVITRNAIVGVLLERKKKLNRRLDETDNPGEIARLIQEIAELNKEINRMKGISE